MINDMFNFYCTIKCDYLFLLWCVLVKVSAWKIPPHLSNVFWLSTSITCCCEIWGSRGGRMSTAGCHLRLLGQHPGSTCAPHLGTEGRTADVPQRRRGHLSGQPHAERGDPEKRRVWRGGREVLRPGGEGRHHRVAHLWRRAEGGQEHMCPVHHSASDGAGLLPAAARRLRGEAEARHPQGTHLDAEGKLLLLLMFPAQMLFS